jgi:hypothetical protein
MAPVYPHEMAIVSTQVSRSANKKQIRVVNGAVGLQR